MRYLTILLAWTLLPLSGVGQGDPFEIKSTHVVNAQLISAKTTGSILYEMVLNFEVLDGDQGLPKGTTVSALIDENNGARSMMKKITNYVGKEDWTAAEVASLVTKLVKVRQDFPEGEKWLVGWLATPERRKSLESLEMKVDSLYCQETSDEEWSGFASFDYYSQVLPREEDGFLSMWYSKVLVEIPYNSGKWHLGTFIKQNSRYDNSKIQFVPHPDSPKLFTAEGNEEGPLYFKDLWGRMITFELD